MSDQVKSLHHQIVIANGFAIHDPVDISVSVRSEYYNPHNPLVVIIFTYDSPMNSYLEG